MGLGFFNSRNNLDGSIEEIKEVILTIARELVIDRDAVRVSVTTEDQVQKITLTAHKDDIGKLIGKEGRMATAFRTIVFALSSKYKVRAILDIGQPHKKRNH